MQITICTEHETPDDLVRIAKLLIDISQKPFAVVAKPKEFSGPEPLRVLRTEGNTDTIGPAGSAA